MAPLVKEFLKHTDVFETKVCVTAQHREMLDQVLNFFQIEPHYDLNVMKPGQDLYMLTANIINGLKPVLENFNPDFVFVHGDTTTTMAASLASFYHGAKVCHVEAGLRTNNKYSPFPEEMNRSITGRLTDFHLAPTIRSKNNLLKENVEENSIAVTGNTVIDALLFSVEKIKSIQSQIIIDLKAKINFNKKIILVTGHRRENFGDGFLKICEALKEISLNEEVEIVYPVHLNPNVQDPVYQILSGRNNIHLIDPLPYEEFIWLMEKSYLIITDSGGVQEEAPSLGKPVLVMRDTTERPEAVEAGTVILVGTDVNKIVTNAKTLINDEAEYNRMSHLHNPYGDGKASERIVKFILGEKINEYK